MPSLDRVRVGRPMRPPKTAELIAIDLRRQIVRGELRSGETLPSEVALMGQYGVSRPTMREAFRILESESLISVRRGARGGAQVMTPDPSVAARYVGLVLQIQGTTIDDVYEARMVNEPHCARLLARHRTTRDVADLHGCVDQLRAAPLAADWATRFHRLVLERCGNRTLAVQGGVLADIVATHLRAAPEPPPDPTRFHKILRSYEKLIALVVDRDGDGAEEHWRRHMESVGKHLFRGKPVVELFS